MVKKALLIGINYIGTDSELSGCINDINNMQAALQKHGYTLFRKLTDDQPDMKPTKAGILAGIQWLLQDAVPADTLFVHYSGHGTQVLDTNGDEDDRRDEAWCPLDYSTAGFIRDDELRAALVAKCASTLIVVSDSCHSGTILDLRFNYRQTAGYTVTTTQSKKYAATRNRVICLSGCEDAQTSADTIEPNAITGKRQAQGALTATLLQVLSSAPNITYMKLLRELWTRLRQGRYTQVPRLTAGNSLNLNEQVIL